jgi:L-ribulose-5-phosphate 3-epimerase UlaE
MQVLSLMVAVEILSESLESLTAMTRLIAPKNFSSFTRVYPKVSGLAAWNENCKW